MGRLVSGWVGEWANDSQLATCVDGCGLLNTYFLVRMNIREFAAAMSYAYG